MRCVLNWVVKYTPGATTTASMFVADTTSIATVVKGGPNANFPEFLGEANMTTPLSGVTYDVQPGRVMARTIHRYTDPTVLFETTLSGVYPTKLSGTFTGIGSLLNFEQRMNVGILNRINQAVNEFQGGVFIGEIRETLQLLRHPVESILKSCLSLRKAEIRFADKLKRLEKWYRSQLRLNVRKREEIEKRYLARLRWLEKLWGNEWLKFQYGVLPLMSDAQSAVDRLNRIAAKRKRRIVKYNLSDNNESAEGPFHNGAYGWYWQEAGQTSVTARGSSKALIQVLPSLSAYDLSNWGITLQNIVPTLYELTPWTFLLDYFTNVNEILNSTFTEQGDIVWMWAGCEFNYIRTSYITNAVFNLDGQGSANFEPWVITRREVKRWIPTTDENYLAYRMEFPSLGQAINIAALVAVLRK